MLAPPTPSSFPLASVSSQILQSSLQALTRYRLSIPAIVSLLVLRVQVEVGQNLELPAIQLTGPVVLPMSVLVFVGRSADLAPWEDRNLQATIVARIAGTVPIDLQEIAGTSNNTIDSTVVEVQ